MKSTSSTDESTQSEKQTTQPKRLTLGQVAKVVAVVLAGSGLIVINNRCTLFDIDIWGQPDDEESQPDDEEIQPDGQEGVQTEWRVNDKPSLSYRDEGDGLRKIQSLNSAVWGRDPAWWRLEDQGYSQSDSYYTFANGGAPAIDNRAEWRMGSAQGTQEIQIYIPGNSSKPFAATVDYEIQIVGKASRFVRIEQERNKGWVSLGRFDLNGAEVTIRVDDTNAYPHRTRENEHKSRIGINAIRMRCVSNCTP